MADQFMDPYTGSQQHTDDSKKRALEAVATAGTAGLKAFQEAQQGIQANQLAALERARQGSQMFGLDPAAFGANKVQDAFGLQQGNLAGAQADFTAHNQAMGAANASYFDKTNAALGALKGQNEAKTSEYDAQIQAYKTRLEQEAAAAAAAAQAKEQAEMNRLMIREQGENARTQFKENAATQRETRKQATDRVNKTSLDELVGLAIQNGGWTRKVQGVMPGGAPMPDHERTVDEILSDAKAIGKSLGLDPVTLAGLDNPKYKEGINNARPVTPKNPPPGFDKNWLLGSFRYDGKPISTKRADEVLRAPEVSAANQFIGTLANTRITNGRINDASAGEYQGLTPEEAFNRWINAQPGIRTMKTALRDYYTPWIKSTLK